MLQTAKYSETYGWSEVAWGVVRLVRPRQWIKNGFLFAALVFSGELFSAQVAAVAAGTLYFCLASSTVYVLNDLVDAERDALHPQKRFRPIPAGVVPRRLALATLCLLLALWLPGALLLDSGFGAVTACYFALNLAYSFGLKHQFMLDVMCIAMGFVLRAVAGALLIDAPVSPWLFLCTILLALFLALGKRRTELAVAEPGHREVLAFYTTPLVDQFLSGLSGTTIIAYSLYTFYAPGGPDLMWTIPFVLYGIFRYLYLVHRTDLGGAPEEALLTDRPLLINLMLWGSTVVVLLYR